MLAPGAVAPEFSATTQAGTSISLREFRGRKVVVLYFYPRDNTPVCTAQACGFRDAYEEFVTAGAVVIGVSVNSLASHEAFAAKHRLPFHLVSDADGALAKLFDVKKSLGILPGRVTYVIDKQGIIRHALSALWVADRHVEEALRAVRELDTAG